MGGWKLGEGAAEEEAGADATAAAQTFAQLPTCHKGFFMLDLQCAGIHILLPNWLFHHIITVYVCSAVICAVHLQALNKLLKMK
jgi:hypothetical protein